jgi:hypothetical protein
MERAHESCVLDTYVTELQDIVLPPEERVKRTVGDG